MQQRLQALVDAVNIISPPLTKFYDSLSDEQKARFNDIAPPAPKNAQAQPSAQREHSPTCRRSATPMSWRGRPTRSIAPSIRTTRSAPSSTRCKSALSQAGDTIKAACPTEVPATPPDRLAAVGNRLQAMLQAVETVQPALADFYNSLSDDQKARFNTMGKQLFAQNQ